MLTKKSTFKAGRLWEPLVSILLAFLIGALVVTLIGQNPFSAFRMMFIGAFGSIAGIGITMTKTTALAFTGLSYAFAYHCGLVNIGAEGQFYMGALSATLVVLFMPGPGYLVIIVALIAGFLGGAIFGLLVGVAKAFFGANEVITTVMLNYVAALIVQWATAGPIQAPGATAAETILFDEKYWLLKLVPGTNINIGFFIMIAALVFFGVFLWRTRPGFAMQIVGQNKRAAAYAGISVNRNIMMSMFIAGGLAGLGGAIELLGVQHRLLKGMASNYGFDGMAVSLLGGNLPVGMFFASILMGGMKNGGNSMQMFTSVPSSVVDLIRALVIVFVLINVLGRVKARIRNKKQKEAAING